MSSARPSWRSVDVDNLDTGRTDSAKTVEQAINRSPLADSNRRPPPYHASRPTGTRGQGRPVRPFFSLHTDAMKGAADTPVGTHMAGAVCDMCAIAAEHL